MFKNKKIVCWMFISTYPGSFLKMYAVSPGSKMADNLTAVTHTKVCSLLQCQIEKLRNTFYMFYQSARRIYLIF